MNKRDMEEFEGMIEAMSQVLNLKKKLESRMHECNHSECCDDEDEEDERCPLLLELENEYNQILLWACGDSSRPSCKKKVRKHWEKMHPHLPMPRIIRSEEGLSPAMSTICLLIDVIPLYLANKKYCAG